MIPMRTPVSPPKAPTSLQPHPSAQALVLMQMPTPPCGFSGVTACLHTPELVEVELEALEATMSTGLFAGPGMASISSSHHERWAHGNNLYGHHHNLHWEGDHQWPRSGNPPHWSCHRRQHRQPIGGQLKSTVRQTNGNSLYGTFQNLPLGRGMVIPPPDIPNTCHWENSRYNSL